MYMSAVIVLSVQRVPAISLFFIFLKFFYLHLEIILANFVCFIYLFIIYIFYFLQA